MGYCSDVVIALKQEKDIQEIKIIIEEYDFSPDVETEARGWTILGWNDTKWYKEHPSFPEVDKIMEKLNSIPEEDYLYFRVGEEIGDTDCMGYGIAPIFLKNTIFYYPDKFSPLEPINIFRDK